MRSYHRLAVFAFLPTALAAAQTHIDAGVRVRGQDVNVDANVEVLTRGPVHEAFAQTVDYRVDPEVVVRTRRPPPPPIEEYAPEEIPQYGGAEVEWVPGYWSWDEEREDYVWVSGVWRVPPPNADWMPGYWADGPQGYEYTSGAWVTEDEDDEVEYLPPPPPPYEEGPVAQAPSPNHIWVAGSWYWEDSWGFDVNVGGISVRGGGGRQRDRGYIWRPGHWVVGYPDWVWVPAHYVWTPRGCIFVAGYWDYPLERRGVLFTPVYFAQPALVQEVRYTPRIAIDVNILTDHLFTRPRHCSYYFGDYYDVAYVQRGYKPFFEVDRRYCYDPILVNMRYRHRDRDDRFVDDLRRDYDFRREHVDARPARTYRAQLTRGDTFRDRRDDPRDVRRDDPRGGERVRKSLAVARPLNQLESSSESRVKLARVSDDQREQLARRSRDVQDFKEQRRTREAGPKAADVQREATGARERPERPDRPDAPRAGSAQKVKVSRSPISGRTAEARSRAPQRPESSDGPEPRKVRTIRKGGDREGDRPSRDRDDDKDDKDKKEKKDKKGDD